LHMSKEFQEEFFALIALVVGPKRAAAPSQ
jgi:hypothetical protein